MQAFPVLSATGLALLSTLADGAIERTAATLRNPAYGSAIATPAWLANPVIDVEPGGEVAQLAIGLRIVTQT